MNDIKIFSSQEFGTVRVVEIDGIPMLVGSDAATMLGYVNPQKAIRDHVDEEDKLTERIVLSGQLREVILINESGFYSLVLSSKLPTAKSAKRWVTSEVLPSIRKTGGYMIAKPEDTPEELMARALLVAKDALKRREERIANLEQQTVLQSEQLQIAAPKVNYYDRVLQSTSTYNINQIAKEFGMSAETMNKKLKELGIQYKQGGQWLLTHKYQDQGYTKTRTHPYIQHDGKPGTAMQTVWTEKGREFIHNLFNLKNTIVTGVKELSRIYDNMDDLEKKEEVFSEPLYTDLSKIDAMYDVFRSVYCKSKMTVYDRKKFLFVVVLLYCPKTLAGKKMKSGLREKMADVLNIKARTALSDNVKDLVKIYDSDSDFKKDVSRAYKFITKNITPDINNPFLLRLQA